MDLELAGKRAIVTGGSRGIGLAIADQLAAEGADVALVARDESVLRQAADDIARSGHRVLAIAAHTTNDVAERGFVEQVVSELGGIDILVNAAARPGGGSPPPSLADVTDDDLRVEFETKVLGYLRCARAVAPHMQAQQWAASSTSAVSPPGKPDRSPAPCATSRWRP
jgi:NAD(P)-dependent dehydrogenase (short-subunit alcohol dehydrogenase family)